MIPAELAGPPPLGTPVPAAVVDLAESSGERIVPVWRSELGTLTYRLETERGDGSRFAKWNPRTAPFRLSVEAEKLRWAASFARVPRVLELREDEQDGAQLLITAPLPGRSAVDPLWIAQPRVAARALGVGLRALHDALPVARCPFSWSVEQRLARSSASARTSLKAPEPVRLVVCHGDACAPNTLLADDGSVTGHVDLGSLGVADFWADLAIASWSAEWNYGPGFEHLVYEGYGVDADAERIAFYRALWDAT
ncbi:MAG TPA: aminoglycoside 3'-phosphotransferase [Polyangiaceae bacterium]|nr:aminoglycoside 3'-phosphotransferase [Polyangiaceae bacterium]